MMPTITGVDLARAIRKVSPNTQVVLMTAYGTRRLRDTTKIVGVDAYLDKPFTFDEIHRVVVDTVRLAHQEIDIKLLLYDIVSDGPQAEACLLQR